MHSNHTILEFLPEINPFLSGLNKMHSQKRIEWLGKNFVLQGLAVFSGAKAYIR